MVPRVERWRGCRSRLLFEKPSLRTKLSFWIGVEKLGARPLYFSPEEVGLGKREPVSDVAKVLASMADMAVVRTFAQATLDEFGENCDVPVINALTDEEHPCQALADVMTMLEIRGYLDDVRVAFIGDGNNVAASLGVRSSWLRRDVRSRVADGLRVAVRYATRRRGVHIRLGDDGERHSDA